MRNLSSPLEVVHGSECSSALMCRLQDDSSDAPTTNAIVVVVHLCKIARAMATTTSTNNKKHCYYKNGCSLKRGRLCRFDKRFYWTRVEINPEANLRQSGRKQFKSNKSKKKYKNLPSGHRCMQLYRQSQKKESKRR